MHRIDGPGATADNRFTLGNSGAGIDATDVTADIMNAIQEEICAVIEASGVVLSKPTNTQLLEAIRRLSMSTGDVKFTIKTAADPGWVMCNDGTIGSAASGATTRAHADTEALYTLLWAIPDAYAPVTGGRGASAAADFAANKPIALTKMLGRALALAGAGVGLTARALGSTTGAETHVLSQAETPLKSHTHAATQAAHSHIQQNNGDNGIATTGAYTAGSDTPVGTGAGGTSTQSATPAITVSAASDTTASAHNNMQPTSFLNAMIKL